MKFRSALIGSLTGCGLVATGIVVGLNMTNAAEDVAATGDTAPVSVEGCQMADVVPSRGKLQLEYLRPSSAQDPDRNDYRLSGTVMWDDPDALSCFDDGTVDWAYEHSIEYGEPVERVIWDEDLSSFADAQPYIDTTVDSNKNHTELSVGIAKPERLTAGKEYSFSYNLLLSNNPQGGKQYIALWGQVIEKQCSSGKPWCSGLNTATGGRQFNSDPLWVGWTRGFAVKGTTCWAWTSDGAAPTDCSPQPPAPVEEPTTPAPQPAEPAEPAPSTTAPPAAEQTPASVEPPTPEQPVEPQAPQEPEAPQTPATASGAVQGCNTYGSNCDGNPIYVSVPQDGYNYKTEPKVATVPNGTVLTARCFTYGTTIYNWAITQNDPGPNPYDSNIHYSVQAPDGQWGFIPDTYFVRDRSGLGLREC